MTGDLAHFPVAAASALLTYAVLAGLAVPPVRRVLAPRLLLPPSLHQRHVAGFDALRGAAAALIAVGHCVWMTSPTFDAAAAWTPIVHKAVKAVPVFCAISGFLIYRSLAGAETLQDLRDYLLRRFFRLYPLYAVSVLIALAMTQYAASQMAPDARPLARFVADLFMFRVLWWPGYGNPVAWSLYHEVLFYALLPLAILAFGRRRMLAVALLGLLAMLAGDYPSRDFGLWKYFLVGIAASELTDRMGRLALPAFAASAVLFAVDVVNIDWVARILDAIAGGATGVRQDGQTFGLALACFLLLASLPRLHRLRPLLEATVPRLAGSISYSVFLLHPFYIWANVPEIGSLTAIDRSALVSRPESTAFFWLVFVPGLFSWGMIGFVLVERPGIRLGRMIVARGRSGPAGRAPDAAQPAA